jgi:hypothetical protein
MIPREAVERQVQRLRRTAKFIAVQHSSEFIDESADLGEGFFTANLYDERIDSNMIVTKHGRVMIKNTYIASFAYNLFLCWLYAQKNLLSHDGLNKLLAHNFKKFFAEQIYRQTNRVPSRALLLETLLFEQAIMVDVFDAKEKDPKLSADADTAAGLMSFALSMHELGHYYIATKPELWSEILESEGDTITSLYERVVREGSSELAIEFQCDVYAVIGSLNQYKNYAGEIFSLRAIVFAFAAYAAMYSATATAKATAALWDAGPVEAVDFLDITPMPDVDHDTEWAVDPTFLQRAALVAELCTRLANRRGFTLFNDEDSLPLPATIVRDLADYVGRVFECADENGRKMSNLVAIALHGHDAGMEYLYLRSKTFRTNRTAPLKVQNA